MTSNPTLTVQPLPHSAVTSMTIMNKVFTCKPEWTMAAMTPSFHLLTYGCAITASCAHDQGERVRTGKLCKLNITTTSSGPMPLFIQSIYSSQLEHAETDCVERKQIMLRMYRKCAHNCFRLNDTIHRVWIYAFPKQRLRAVP